MPPPTPEFLAESTAPQILIGSILPAALATVFVLARFWSRAIITKSWGWDDSWILFSWVCRHDCLDYNAKTLLARRRSPIDGSQLLPYQAGRGEAYNYYSNGKRPRSSADRIDLPFGIPSCHLNYEIWYVRFLSSHLYGSHKRTLYLGHGGFQYTLFSSTYVRVNIPMQSNSRYCFSSI